MTSSYSRRCFRTEKFLRFDLFLRALDGARDHAVLDRHAFFHTELLHQAEIRSDPKIRIRSSWSDR